MGKVTVSINQREYILSGDRPAEDIKRIAAKVDEEMLKIAEKDPFSSIADIAVLAALNLSEEIFDTVKKEEEEKAEKLAQETREREDKIKNYEEKIKELQNKVSEYENNYFDLQMENIKLKDELDRLK